MSNPELQDTAFTPREIVNELDRFIVGQNKAKRAVAIALRNRWRRQRVEPELRDEITPKNIILIGSTGVGKTEIARRLAKLAKAPFIKIEASKFTEVGYVGRDVDSMIRDLTESAVQMVREQATEQVMVKARQLAEDRVLSELLPKPKYEQQPSSPQGNPSMSFTDAHTDDADNEESQDSSRERLRTMLRKGELKDRELEIEAEDRSFPTMQIFSNSGMEEMGMNLQEMMGKMTGNKRTRKRRVSIDEAMELFAQEEASNLVDEEWVIKEAIQRAENHGIVFLDEIDKIAKRDSGGQGPDVSREGVQRDILPVVEGSTVTTKYGAVRTDHILFIAAGAFHVSKVSDLIPELQGRFPIRVELDSLGEKELLQILKEPQNALPLQHHALMDTEQVELEFSDTGLGEIARIAAIANARAENIGARRLHTVFEQLLEEISFSAPEKSGSHIQIDAGFVRDRLSSFLENEDLSRYIL